MKKITDYKNKKILVLGLAKSGKSVAKLLHKLGAQVIVNDLKQFDNDQDTQELIHLGIHVVTGKHPIELLDGITLMVKNPGIPYTNPMIIAAQLKNIPIVTEVELAYQIADCPIIGITGTNGKTTTTMMIQQILDAGRQQGKARLAGNIGYPASEITQHATKDDLLVMELSSFQLLGVSSFYPTMAVITNIYEAHLDYHKTRENYVSAKWQIQQNMEQEDQLIINWNQPELREMVKTTRATVVPFSTYEVVNGAYLLNETLYFKDEIIMSVDELGVPGNHNIENALAAICVAKLYNIANESIRETLHRFSGVAHRTQYIDTIKQRKFYNDSKATNILATKMALSGFPSNQLILLAGGLDRGNDFDELIPVLKDLKGIVLFGETKEKLRKIAKNAGVLIIKTAANMTDAVREAFEISQKNDTILLSPACASWDQYPNFEIRGEAFIKAVEQLKENEK